MLELIPPGSLHDQIQAQLALAQSLPSEANTSAGSKSEPGSELELAQKQRDELERRFNEGLDELNELTESVGQASPEFDRSFGEWLKVKDEYETVCDQMVVLEARIQLVQWLATLPSPKQRR